MTETMFSGMNKDTAMLLALVSLAAVCAFLYKENMKNKEEITSCKSFSINLSNRIPSVIAPKPQQKPEEVKVEEEIEEE